MGNRLTPLDPPLTPDIAALLDRYPQQDGYLLTLFRTFANSERFLRKGVPNLLDRASPLPLRLREIVILRVTARRGCEYEWGVHVAIFARAARLETAHVTATVLAGAEADCWSAKEARLIAAIDALLDGGRITEPLKDGFASDWSVEQQLEILALCGAYQTISFVANLAELPMESFAARFPDRA